MSDVEKIKVGICFIFNHPFPKQIPVIREIYGSRFSKMLFLIPFSRDNRDDPDVHTVYRTAFSFDGMLIEARHRIMQQFEDCSHIMFVHNDLLLSGEFDETSTYSKLKLNENPAFLAEIAKIGGPIFSWLWFARFAYRWKFPMDPLLGSGAEKAKEYLPPLSEIEANCIKAGFSPEQSRFVRDEPRKLDKYYFPYIDEQLFAHDAHLDEHGQFNLGYPLFHGYADLFCVSTKGIGDWLHLLGLLSALDVFSEIAIPTSLIWHFGKINTANSCELSRSVLWSDRHLANDIDWVIGQYQAGDSYIHPVKYEKYSKEDYAQLMDCLADNTDLAVKDEITA